MGIYIKGMEMPHDCDSCKISNVLDCTLWKPMDIGERHPECPLVEVPTPHNSLIDEFVEYVEDNFEASVTAEETSDCDTFDKIFGTLPEQEDE